MAEEIKNEEILDEEDLAQVAGGTQDQVYGDYNQLKKINFLIKDGSKTTPEVVQASMNNLIEDFKKKGFGTIEYKENWNSDKNVYSINGDNSLTQDQFWAEINKHYLN